MVSVPQSGGKIEMAVDRGGSTFDKSVKSSKWSKEEQPGDATQVRSAEELELRVLGEILLS